jgi:hydrogenase maturation protease
VLLCDSGDPTRNAIAATSARSDAGVAEVSCGPQTLLLGIGNTLLADDGAGVRLIERLRADPDMAALMLIDGGTMSFSLLSYLEGTGALLAVDAANLEAPAGTVQVFEEAAMDRFICRSRGRSVHEVGLADLMDMARLHGCLPRRRALVCIQPARIDWGEPLSEAVLAAMPYACAQVRNVLRRWAP